MPVPQDYYAYSKILVVDDHQSNNDLLKALLTKAGYKNIRTTTDPTSVLSLQLEVGFDIILLDIQMPIMNGLEVMAQLNDHLEDDDYLPILILSADNEIQTRMLALSSGAKDFVNKPFQRDEVLNRIHNILETRHLYKQQKLQTVVLTAEVKRRTLQIAETQIKMIHCLGKAVEYRDCETGLHVIRMSRYCELLAKKVGFSDEEAELVLLSSPMHDIGKIGIPDSVLLKRGRLDHDEMEIMKTHAALGSAILPDDDQPIFKMAKTIALGHHEKWDGSGYPNGLSGKDIPLVCRIVAICDVFDALQSNRPYKDEWSLDNALEYIRSSSGSHFEPNLVELFFDILPDILYIQEVLDGSEIREQDNQGV
jgi:putative two-component system response regulator